MGHPTAKDLKVHQTTLEKKNRKSIAMVVVDVGLENLLDGQDSRLPGKSGGCGQLNKTESRVKNVGGGGGCPFIHATTSPNPKVPTITTTIYLTYYRIVATASRSTACTRHPSSFPTAPSTLARSCKTNYILHTKAGIVANEIEISNKALRRSGAEHAENENAVPYTLLCTGHTRAVRSR